MSEKLLTFSQVYFLANKLGYRIGAVTDTRYKYKAPEYAIAEDGSLVDSSNLSAEMAARNIQEFWYIRYEDWIKSYQQRGYGYAQLRHVAPLSKNFPENPYEYHALEIVPRDFISACEKYFGKAPFYVKDKQVSTIYVKQNGTIKPAKPYIKQNGQIKAL